MSGHDGAKYPGLQAPDVRWLAPTSLDEALRLRSEYRDEATIVAGGTYLGILMNQGLLAPAALLSLRKVPGLDYVEVEARRSAGTPALLRLGAMTTHRTVERSPLVRNSWPALARAFSLVASPRVRNQATVGGVLADADYASDPPAMLTALAARVVLQSRDHQREVPVEDFIIGYYETVLQPDELLVEVQVPGDTERAVYRKFRSRSTEDRPCVAVAVAKTAPRSSTGSRSSTGKTIRVVVGAVTERPQYFPDICALAHGNKVDDETAAEIGRRYAAAITSISDARGSGEYRRRIIAVEVRRALEELDRGRCSTADRQSSST
jgi:carbon-monoxide dehydrogenase medium subunit